MIGAFSTEVGKFRKNLTTVRKLVSLASDKLQSRFFAPLMLFSFGLSGSQKNQLRPTVIPKLKYREEPPSLKSGPDHDVNGELETHETDSNGGRLFGFDHGL